jgi:hypothetical protein
MDRDEELKAKAMSDLIVPSFERIHTEVVAKGFKAEWVRRPDHLSIKFSGPEKKEGEFSATATAAKKPPEVPDLFPGVVFNWWRRRSYRSSNNVCEPIANWTPEGVLAAFKMLFTPWFR